MTNFIQNFEATRSQEQKATADMEGMIVEMLETVSK
jgi:hypothetical protein